MQPFIVGVPDFRSGVGLNFEMDYIQYRDPYLYVSYCPWLDLAVYAETYQDLIRKTDEVYWGLRAAYHAWHYEAKGQVR